MFVLSKLVVILQTYSIGLFPSFVYKKVISEFQKPLFLARLMKTYAKPSPLRDCQRKRILEAWAGCALRPPSCEYSPRSPARQSIGVPRTRHRTSFLAGSRQPPTEKLQGARGIGNLHWDGLHCISVALGFGARLLRALNARGRYEISLNSVSVATSFIEW